MFPCDMRFAVVGEPNFADPTKAYHKFGKDLEAIVAEQDLRFGETGLYPPHQSSDEERIYFDYRIFKGETSSSPYEPIHFEYSKTSRKLRVHSDIPEFKVRPIVDFIAEHYLVSAHKSIVSLRGADFCAIWRCHAAAICL